MPPLPKPPGLRQRRNKVSTRSLLESAEKSARRKVPELPQRPETEKWHSKVLEWWKAVWKSPMAGEFLEADKKGGLYLLAELQQKRWTTADVKELVALSSEIRQQEVRFGLSPIDRRRLQWEVERGEQAEERVTRRRKAKEDDKQRAGKDPREILKVHEGGKK